MINRERTRPQILQNNDIINNSIDTEIAYKPDKLKIGQWNARGLTDDTKVTELVNTANLLEVDILMLSELGWRRRIPHVPKYIHTDIDTQSAIFCRDSVEMENETPKAIKVFEAKHIQTQLIAMINNEFILCHIIYISPGTNQTVRNAYWTEIHKLVKHYNQTRTPFITAGDFNTSDYRLGHIHTRRYQCMDHILTGENKLYLLSDPEIPTRLDPPKCLDVCLGNEHALTSFDAWSVLNNEEISLPSDHTLINIIHTNSARHTEDPETTNKEHWYTSAVDISATKKAFTNWIEEKETESITLEDYNQGLIQALKYKRKKNIATKWWSQELDALKTQRIKTAKLVRQDRQQNRQMLERRTEELKRIKCKMRQAIKGAKRTWLTDRINEALEDPIRCLNMETRQGFHPKNTKTTERMDTTL